MPNAAVYFTSQQYRNNIRETFFFYMKNVDGMYIKNFIMIKIYSGKLIFE